MNRIKNACGDPKNGSPQAFQPLPLDWNVPQKVWSLRLALGGLTLTVGAVHLFSPL